MRKPKGKTGDRKPGVAGKGTVWFLIAEGILFLVIILGEFRNRYFARVRYSTVLLCGLVSLILLIRERRKENGFLLIAMAFTAAADWFLVIKDEAYEWSVGLFLCAQLFHFGRITAGEGKHCRRSARIRFGVSMAFFLVLYFLKVSDTVVYLGALYVTELLINGVDAAFRGRKEKRFYFTALGFLLFFFCDLCVGLNGMGGDWGIPVKIRNICADLIWVWYLPSQVLIVLTGRKCTEDNMNTEETDYVGL